MCFIRILIRIRIIIRDRNLCSASDDSDDDINRNAEDKETEIMEDLAMAQAMEPKNDVRSALSFCWGCALGGVVLHSSSPVQ